MQTAEPQDTSIVLEINGEIWEQVRSFDFSGPRDQHFMVETGEDAKTYILFGDGEQGRRPPSGARRLGINLTPGSNYARIMLQEESMEEDEDEREMRLYGLYRGVVINNQDPENRLRLLVRVPEALGLQETWALSCLPPGASSAPSAGKIVWVMFEQGEPDYPVWMGVLREE